MFWSNDKQYNHQKWTLFVKIKKKKKDLKALFITIWYLQRKGIDIMQSKTPTDKNSIKIQRTNN